ncbi:MAG: hypothetical protein WD072_12825 [Pirellulales bacterium]
MGTLIVSGGPEPAFIGRLSGRENFNGIIDELAFYNFALKADEINEHHEHARGHTGQATHRVATEIQRVSESLIRPRRVPLSRPMAPNSDEP